MHHLIHCLAYLCMSAAYSGSALLDLDKVWVGLAIAAIYVLLAINDWWHSEGD